MYTDRYQSSNTPLARRHDDDTNPIGVNPDRRGFLKAAGAAGVVGLSIQNQAALPLTEKDKLARIASNTWPLRYLFKNRVTGRRANPQADAMKKKYGEITVLDFPQFTQRHVPRRPPHGLVRRSVRRCTDDTTYAQVSLAVGQTTRTAHDFDPSTASANKWLDKLAGKIASTGVKCHHISNNAPRDICDLDAEKRKAGIVVTKTWLFQHSGRIRKLLTHAPIAPGE